MSKQTVWTCNACGAKLTGLNWREVLNKGSFHHTPTGGECRAIDFRSDNFPGGSESPDAPAAPVTDRPRETDCSNRTPDT